MELNNIRDKVVDQIRHMADHAIITNRRFLDDEQLLRSEQLAVLEEVFNSNVRDAEIREITSHFAPIIRDDHPVHLAVWGKTGTGKTLTLRYLLNLMAEMCREQGIAYRCEHLDLSSLQPCFRALNDLACLLNASKRYKKGISLDELMLRIEAALARYRGYLILFIDEVDNVRRDKDTFLSFLIRRLPQRIPGRLVLVFASNRLGWVDHLDPRVKSFLKLNELIFEPYDAIDLQRILAIRVQKALKPGAVEPGVVEKIAALSSRDHGDARQAVGLLARCADLAEKHGHTISLDAVDQAASEIEQDRYLTMIRTAPAQLQAAMASVIVAVHKSKGKAVTTFEAFDTYRSFCHRAQLRPLQRRGFSDLLAELDLYCLLVTRVLSRGRYGRVRQIALDLPESILRAIEQAILRRFELPGDSVVAH